MKKFCIECGKMFFGSRPTNICPVCAVRIIEESHGKGWGKDTIDKPTENDKEKI